MGKKFECLKKRRNFEKGYLGEGTLVDEIRRQDIAKPQGLDHPGHGRIYIHGHLPRSAAIPGTQKDGLGDKTVNEAHDTRG